MQRANHGSRSRRSALLAFVVLVGSCLGVSETAHAGTEVLFGPVDFVRAKRRPAIFVKAFEVDDRGAGLLRVVNGGKFDKVSSGVVLLNGFPVLLPRDFNQNVELLERQVVLWKRNVLIVALAAKPGAGITLEILGERDEPADETPPEIVAMQDPPPNEAGWNNTDVDVRFDCSDEASGIDFCTDPIPVSTEGAGQVVEGRAIDGAGNEATTSLTLNIDKTEPALQVTSPADGSVVSTAIVELSGTVSDALSGVSLVSCNDNPGAIADGSFSCQVELDEGENQVVVQAGDVAGNVAFVGHRLTLASTTGAPSVSDLVVPSEVPYTSDVSIEFAYADPDGDIASLLVTSTGPLGTSSGSVSASLLGIEGISGVATLSSSASTVPFGDTSYTLQLKDADGNLSNEIAFTLRVTGESSGGTPPTLDGLVAVEPQWNRPVGVLDRLAPLFSLSYSDPEEDILRVLVGLTGPSSATTIREQDASALGIGGSSGTVTRAFFDFDSESALGTYRVDLTLIDSSGNRSDTVSASLELSAAGGRLPVHIDSFAPAQGPAGTEVTLMGQGFETVTLESNQVELSEVPLQVQDVTASSITVVIPEGAGSGPFVIRNDNGGAVSADVFVVPAGVVVLPEQPAVVVGATLQFLTKIVSSEDTAVRWSVNGIEGGSALNGTITGDGLYTAPAGLPPDAVSISATLVADPSVSDERELSFVAPPETPGSALLLSSLGGTVRSVGLRSSVQVPAGALSADAVVSIRELRGAELPPEPPSGERVVSAVELGPGGTAFQTPVTVTAPLARYFPPGTILPAVYFEPASGTYQDEGLSAVVLDNGDRAAVSVSHFSVLAILEKLGGGPPVVNPPFLDSIYPAEGQEGRNVPVLLTGGNFSAQMDVEILNGGVPSPDIVPVTWVAAGDRAGLLLDIQTIVDLGDGQSRNYTVQVRRRNDGAVVSTTFAVHGLDELIVGQNQNVSSDTLVGPFSEVDIDGVVNVIGDRFDLESTGPVSITGTIQARGDDGEPAPPISCAGLSPGEGTDQCGQAGPGDGRGGLGRDSGDDPEPKHSGADSPGARGHNSGNPRGVGGAPGNNVELGLPDPGDLVDAAEDCASAVQSQMDLADCGGLAGEILGLVALTTDLLQSPTGRRGFGAVSSSSGGGGGGGGRIQTETIPLVLLPVALGLGITGGGGGAGGMEGDTVRLVSSDVIHLGSGGSVDARGGTGGDGSTLGSLQLIPEPDVSTVIPLVGSAIDAFLEAVLGDLSVTLDLPLPGLTGGGAGGGSGGAVSLVSAQRITFSDSISPDSPSNQVNVDGGVGGIGGQTFIDQGAHGSRIVANEASIGARGARSFHDPHGDSSIPVFDPDSIDDMVTNRSILPVRFRTSRGEPLFLRIEAPGQKPRELEATLLGSFYRVNVVLFQGENLLCVSIEAGRPCESSPMPDLLQKRIVSVFLDSDGDGLSDVDEIAFGTDRFDADTDDDGLSDSEEVLNGSNPLNGDSDNDGLPDGEEVHLHATDPNDSDSDGDSVKDGVEVILLTDPRSDASTPTDIPVGTLLSAAGADLAIVQPSTGAMGIMGQPNGGFGFGIAFDQTASLFVAQGSRLAQHDPLSELTTDVGPFHDSNGDTLSVTQIGFNPADGSLYGVEDGPPPGFEPTGQLLRIDRSTAEVTRIGAPLPDSIQSIAFSRDGVLFAALFDGTSVRLVELDETTAMLLSENGSISSDPVFGMTITRIDPLTGMDTMFASNVLSNDQTDLLDLDRSNASSIIASTLGRPLFSLSIKPCPAPCLESAPGSPLAMSVADVDGGDWDGDGDTDLLVVGSGAAPFSVALSALLGNGSGAFAPGASVALPDHQLSEAIADSVAFGHLNPLVDMFPDVVFADQSSASVRVFFGDGLGGFVPSGDNPIVFPAAVANTLNDVAIADVGNPNPGSSPDILVTGFGLAGFVGVFEGDGLGGFVPGFSFPGGNAGATNLDIGDVNGDGVLDVANGSFFLSVSIHVSDLTDPVQPYKQHLIQDPPLNGPYQIALGRLDGDAFLDLVIMGQEGAELGVALWDDAAQTFGPISVFPIAAGPLFAQTIALDDMTGDGVDDAVTGNQDFSSGTSNVIVSVGDGAGSLGAGRVAPTIGAPNAVELVDVDGDGRLDIVVAGETAIEVFLTRSSF